MKKRWMVLTAVGACLLLAQGAMAAGSDAATVSITATVDGYAEWADAAPAIAAADWDSHIVATNTPQTVTKALTLYSNVTTTVTPTAGANSGILTNGAETLVTSYEVTGDVDTPDAAYKDAGTGAGQFFDTAPNSYTITHVSGTGSYTVNLLVKAVSQTDQAPDAGDYTCGVVLTASW